MPHRQTEELSQDQLDEHLTALISSLQRPDEPFYVCVDPIKKLRHVAPKINSILSYSVCELEYNRYERPPRWVISDHRSLIT